jgi:SAM-dependent methyltransferase
MPWNSLHQVNITGMKILLSWNRVACFAKLPKNNYQGAGQKNKKPDTGENGKNLTERNRQTRKWMSSKTPHKSPTTPLTSTDMDENFTQIIGMGTALSQEIVIDQSSYQTFVKKNVSHDVNVPRLVVISYLPSQETIILLKLCVDTILKFTDSLYELWVIDNNSPVENLQWLIEYKNINLAFNRTKPAKSGGSYANAIGLEIGRRVIDAKSKYMMTLHQDTVVCATGWLTYLLSKFNDKVKAVGVRKDTVRVQAGILHVLGYLVDFQLLKELNLDFFPDLPKYDVGDRVIVGLRDAGYDIFATPNTLWQKELIPELPAFPPFKEINVDRSIHDDGHVIFAHLGRGVRKSTENNDKKIEKSKSIDTWKRFIEKYLLNSVDVFLGNYSDYAARLQHNNFYSLRRYFVDIFFEENISCFGNNSLLLDMGGKKDNKRGLFDIDQYTFSVEYANVDESTDPDYCCDIKNIPVLDRRYDGVILSEVLEHVLRPELILAEAWRVLKPGGILLIVTPFNFHIHGDPEDYGRYTPNWYKVILEDVGFDVLRIEKQGLFFLVMANMLGLWFQQKSLNKNFKNRVHKYLCTQFLNWFRKNSFQWDAAQITQNNFMFSGYTTGVGVVCRK